MSIIEVIWSHRRHIIYVHTMKYTLVLCTENLFCLFCIDRLRHCSGDLRNSAGPTQRKIEIANDLNEMRKGDVLLVYRKEWVKSPYYILECSCRHPAQAIDWILSQQWQTNVTGHRYIRMPQLGHTFHFWWLPIGGERRQLSFFCLSNIDVWIDEWTLTVILYSSGTYSVNLNFPSLQKPSSGVIVNVNSDNTFGSLKYTLHVLGKFCSISCASFTSRRSRIDALLAHSFCMADGSFFNFRVRVIIFFAMRFLYPSVYEHTQAPMGLFDLVAITVVFLLAVMPIVSSLLYWFTFNVSSIYWFYTQRICTICVVTIDTHVSQAIRW